VFVENIKQKEKQAKRQWKHRTEKRNAGAREI